MNYKQKLFTDIYSSTNIKEHLITMPQILLPYIKQILQHITITLQSIQEPHIDYEFLQISNFLRCISDFNEILSNINTNDIKPIFTHIINIWETIGDGVKSKFIDLVGKYVDEYKEEILTPEEIKNWIDFDKFRSDLKYTQSIEELPDKDIFQLKAKKIYNIKYYNLLIMLSANNMLDKRFQGKIIDSIFEDNNLLLLEIIENDDEFIKFLILLLKYCSIQNECTEENLINEKSAIFLIFRIISIINLNIAKFAEFSIDYLLENDKYLEFLVNLLNYLKVLLVKYSATKNVDVKLLFNEILNIFGEVSERLETYRKGSLFPYNIQPLIILIKSLN